MMKKAVIAVVVLIIIIGGGYLIFHKNPKSTTSTTTQTSSSPTVSNAVLITKTSSSVGQYLADPSGKTLYTYSSDSSGASNCTGSCLATWPAYLDTGSTTNLPTGVSTIKRSDNSKIQYTYNGMPLYYFVSDGLGQVTGNGVQNFQVAKPSSSTSTQSTPSQSTTQPSSNSSSGSSYSY